MTYEELISGYLNRLKDPRTRNREIQNIINEINKLTYEINGELINNEYKLKIYEELRSKVVTTKVFSEEYRIYKSSNDDFLDMVDAVINKLKGK